MSEPPELDLLTPKEVQKFLRVGRNQVYAMLASGEIPHLRLGRQYRVPRAALGQWVRRNLRTEP